MQTRFGIYLTLTLFVRTAVAAPITPIPGCRPLEVLERARVELQLAPAEHPELRRFMEERFIPVVASGIFLIDPAHASQCSTSGSCIWLTGFGGGLDIRFALEPPSPGSLPSMTFAADGTRTLHIPRDTNWEALPRLGRDLLQRFLIGHPLHPFTASRGGAMARMRHGEHGLILKDTQREAATAAQWMIEHPEHGRRLQFIAPTGVGKTEVLKALFRARLNAPNPRGLYLLVADQNMLVTQLYEDMQSMRQEGMQFGLLQWGGEGDSTVRLPDGTEQPVRGLAELARVVAASPYPIVLSTTRSTLASEFGISADSSDTAEDLGTSTDEATEGERTERPLPRAVQARFNLIRPLLRLLAYDEAHHAGANQASQIITHLTTNAPDAFLYGTTATPLHRTRSLSDIFGPAFYAYHDTARTFIDRIVAGTTEEPSVEIIIDQLSHAIQAGELTPFGEVHFINTDQIEGGLYERNERGRQVPREDLRDSIARTHRRAILEGRASFASYPSTDAADAMKAVYERVIPEIRGAVEVLHSYLPPDEQKRVRARMRRDEVKLLITVAQLDEGINFPQLDTFLDMNPNVGPRRIIQRIGRVLRLLDYKRFARIYMAMSVDENSIRASLQLLQAIRSGALGGVPPADERPPVGGDDLLPATPDETILPTRTATELEVEIREFWNTREERELPNRLIAWFRDHPVAPRSAGANLLDGERALYLAVWKRLRGDSVQAFQTAVQAQIEVIQAGPTDQRFTPSQIRLIRTAARIVAATDPVVDRLITWFRDHAQAPQSGAALLLDGESALYEAVRSRLLGDSAESFRIAVQAQIEVIQAGPVHQRLTPERIRMIQIAAGMVTATDPVVDRFIMWFRDHAQAPRSAGANLLDGESTLYSVIRVRLRGDATEAFRTSVQSQIDAIQAGPIDQRLTPERVRMIHITAGMIAETDPLVDRLITWFRIHEAAPRSNGALLLDGESALNSAVGRRLRGDSAQAFQTAVQAQIEVIQAGPTDQRLTPERIRMIHLAAGLVTATDPLVDRFISWCHDHTQAPRSTGTNLLNGERPLYSAIRNRLRGDSAESFRIAVQAQIEVIQAGPVHQRLTPERIRMIHTAAGMVTATDPVVDRLITWFRDHAQAPRGNGANLLDGEIALYSAVRLRLGSDSAQAFRTSVQSQIDAIQGGPQDQRLTPERIRMIHLAAGLVTATDPVVDRLIMWFRDHTQAPRSAGANLLDGESALYTIIWRRLRGASAQAFRAAVQAHIDAVQTGPQDQRLTPAQIQNIQNAIAPR